MTISETIHQKLADALDPESLEVINESDHHAGHAGSPGTGESHFRIKIVSPSFAGKSRLAMHQEINEILKEELNGKIHALAIEAKAP